MPGEAAVANLALLLGLLDGREHAIGNEDGVGLRVGQNLVDLPEVEAIGFQPPQGIFEHGQGLLLAFLSRVVGADLGHEEDLVTLALERAAHPFLGASLGVFPGVVEEGDAHINGGVGDAGGGIERFRAGQRGAAKAEGRHHFGVAAEFAFGHRADGGLVGGENRRGVAGEDYACAGGAERLEEAAAGLLISLCSHNGQNHSPIEPRSQTESGSALDSAPRSKGKMVGAVRFELN